MGWSGPRGRIVAKFCHGARLLRARRPGRLIRRRYSYRRTCGQLVGPACATSLLHPMSNSLWRQVYDVSEVSPQCLQDVLPCRQYVERGAVDGPHYYPRFTSAARVPAYFPFD